MITSRDLKLQASYGNGTGADELVFNDNCDGRIDLTVRKNAPFGEITDLATFVFNKADARLIIAYLQTFLD